MSRKSLIICLSVLAVLVAGISVAVSVLYSGVGETANHVEVSDNSSNLLLPAVPTDAMFVCDFSDPQACASSILSANDFSKQVSALAQTEEGSSLKMTVSLHFIGEVTALYIFDVGSAQQQESSLASSIRSLADNNGLYSTYLDCSTLEISRKIGQRSIVLASTAKELVLSSVRHLKASESIINMPGFASATQRLDASNRIFVSNTHFHRLISASLKWPLTKHSSFAKRLSDWMVFDFAEQTSTSTRFDGHFVSDSKDPDIMSVFGTSGVTLSSVSEMLPSYTISAMTMPINNIIEFINSYQAYLDSKQGLQRKLILQSRLKDSTGLAPEDFYNRLEIEEVATASFRIDDDVESVNLFKIKNPDHEILFAGTGVSSLKDYKPAVHTFEYENFAASVFGDMYILKDEGCFTYMNGWIVSGSNDAVKEYTSGRALSYNLREYMENAGLPDLFAREASSFMGYLSYTVEPEAMKGIFKDAVLAELSSTYEGVDYSGAFLSVGRHGETDDISIEVFRNEIIRSKAPVLERNTEVVVSRGPFDVMNSHTGKMNQFYQRLDNNFLCLRDETGKNVWGAPFQTPICGAAQTIDFYGNGKLQILFASGSRLYLIDRLGRLVEDCSTDLNKEILLGPAVYDFAGNKKYNIIVLHKDNTIEMYNLKGERPSVWSTISAPQTVTGLPERIDLSGKTFWIVRTSVQTLIYPFGGGQPLTDFEGDQMILPNSTVTAVDQMTVEVESYDGKKRKIQLG